jgi:hypothetical protein
MSSLSAFGQPETARPACRRLSSEPGRQRPLRAVLRGVLLGLLEADPHQDRVGLNDESVDLYHRRVVRERPPVNWSKRIGVIRDFERRNGGACAS